MREKIIHSDPFETFAMKLDDIKEKPLNDFCKELFQICVEIENMVPRQQEGPNKDSVIGDDTGEIRNRKHMCNAIWEYRREEVGKEVEDFYLFLGEKLGKHKEKGRLNGIPSTIQNNLYPFIFFLHPPFKKEWEIQQEILGTQEGVEKLVKSN